MALHDSKDEGKQQTCWLEASGPNADSKTIIKINFRCMSLSLKLR